LPGSRYIYDLYYQKEAISKKLYEYLLKNGYADANLIAKWKKEGYEKLCCLRCIQSKETNFGSVCICRVPRARLVREEETKDGEAEDGDGDGDGDGEVVKKRKDPDGVGREIECVNCGCRGCASSD
jgi:bud site selection protein 31